MLHDATLLKPDIRAYLEAENAFTASVMDETKPAQEDLFAEIKGRIKEDDSSVPSPDGPYLYSSSHIKGGQYPLIKRKLRSGGEEKFCLTAMLWLQAKPISVLVALQFRLTIKQRHGVMMTRVRNSTLSNSVTLQPVLMATLKL